MDLSYDRDITDDAASIIVTSFINVSDVTSSADCVTDSDAIASDTAYDNFGVFYASSNVA